MIPVALMMDASLPGYGDQSSRRFVVRQATGSPGSLYIQATADIIISAITFNASGGPLVADQPWGMYIAPPGSPTLAANQIGLFLDRLVSVTDRPPLIGGPGGAVSPFPSSDIARGTFQVGTYPQTSNILPIPFCLAAGAAFGVYLTGGDTLELSVWGQTL